MITLAQLIDLGFAAKEAKVYLALLELGPSTAAQIARKAGINRTTAYDILNSLSSDGLINLLVETKVQKFAAEHPNKVVAFLENKIKRTQDKLKQANALIPELLSVFNTKEKPRVRYYEGKDGIREIIEDTLNAAETIYIYASREEMFKILSEKYFQDYFERRTKKGIRTKVISPDTEESRKTAQKDAQQIRESVLIPKDKFYFSTGTIIYNNKVASISWREKFAVIIESEEIANAQKKVFELAWEGAKQFTSSPPQSAQLPA